jgi:hypothetical protein
VTTFNESILLFGGKSDKKHLNDMYCLDTKTWGWKKLFSIEGPPCGSFDEARLMQVSETKVMLVSLSFIWVL